MKVLKIDYIDSSTPSGSGTGNSIADKFHIICDNGLEVDMCVDIWYVRPNEIRERFYDAIKNAIGSCENITDAFEMYLDIVCGKICPYKKQEILQS